MCGIGGWYSAAGDPSPDGALEALDSGLAHRGPDGVRRLVVPGAALLHRRLSIIDLATGWQPLTSADGSVALICNGEIYNHRELRARLEGRGVRFSTRSDCEPLVHRFAEARSLDFLAEVEGMFALAVLDLRERRLWLARDRTGKKPLYLARAGRGWLFASEFEPLRGLLRLREEEPCAIAQFLRHGFVPTPLSAVAGIEKLPAASWTVLDASGRHSGSYWQPPALDETALAGRSDDELVEEFDRLFRAAVARRLMSDVPLGVFLSGGLDSAAIALAARDASPARVLTFNVGFPDRSHDERDAAAATAARLGTEHVSLLLEPPGPDLAERIARGFGEPFADASAVSTFLLAQAARKRITVALSGDGADETLLGYNRYRAARALEHPLGRVAVRALAGTATLFGEDDRYYDESALKKLRLTARLLEEVDAAPYVAPVLFGRRELGRLWAADPALLDAPAPGAEALGSARPLLARMRRADLVRYLQDDIHVKVDRASMAHGLEVRCPFMDKDLLVFTSGLPRRLTLDGRSTKAILRRWLARHLPLAGRAPKHGFEPPTGSWFRGVLGDRLAARVRAGETGLIRSAEVLRLLGEHRDRHRDRGKQLWAIFVYLRLRDAWGS